VARAGANGKRYQRSLVQRPLVRDQASHDTNGYCYGFADANSDPDGCIACTHGYWPCIDTNLNSSTHNDTDADHRRERYHIYPAGRVFGRQ
jgi:hypothetical protein